MCVFGIDLAFKKRNNLTNFININKFNVPLIDVNILYMNFDKYEL